MSAVKLRCIINNDDVMTTKLTISEKCAFHLQVVNSRLPSRNHEFISRMECSITDEHRVIPYRLVHVTTEAVISKFVTKYTLNDSLSIT